MKTAFISPSPDARSLCALLLLGAACLLGCGRCGSDARPCGTFAFNSHRVDGTERNLVMADLAFDFDPAACRAACRCDPIGYIQIVRNFDYDTGAYLYPSSEKEGRATANGWYVDRLPGQKWGYYGRNDDGSFAENLQPGNERAPAVLLDEPSRPETEPWLNFSWQAVSVPVCLQAGSSCENRLLGYHYWSWTVDPRGAPSPPRHRAAGENIHPEVQLQQAVRAWNVQAVLLHKHQFPHLSDL